MVLPALRGEAQHSECDPVKAHWQLNSTTPSAKEANPAPAPARIDESCLMGLQLVIESPRLSSTPPASACPPSCECNMTRVLMCFLPSLCRSSLFYHGAPRLRLVSAMLRMRITLTTCMCMSHLTCTCHLHMPHGLHHVSIPSSVCPLRMDGRPSRAASRAPCRPRWAPNRSSYSQLHHH